MTLPSPHRIASSQFGLSPWFGFVGVVEVEVVNQLLGVSQVLSQLLCVLRDVIALPVHKVLELSPGVP